MTTQSWSAVMAQTNDADFRAWGSDFAAKLLAVGLIHTADTGQINWVTVNRAAINSAAGYEIWRFDDAMQATAPIFLKIEYGSGSAQTIPAVWVTVGTGTDGAGTITGTATARTSVYINGAPAALTRPRYMCHVSGSFGCVFHYNTSTNIPVFAFIVARTVDATGTPSADGCVLYARGTNTSATVVGVVQALRFAATAATFTASATDFTTLIPHAMTSSLVGSDMQVFMHWFPNPRIVPLFSVCSHIQSEISQGSTFTTTLVGTTARTYISIANSIGASVSGSSAYGMAMIWE